MKKLLGLFALATLAFAQAGTIGTGTSITVRTSEKINVKKSDGRIFAGVVDQDVRDANNGVAIPKGSQVELTVKQLAKNDLVLDLESVTVSGQRYALTADDAAMGTEQKDGIGKNKRTADVYRRRRGAGYDHRRDCRRQEGRRNRRSSGSGGGRRRAGPDPGQEGERSRRVLVDVPSGEIAPNGSGG